MKNLKKITKLVALLLVILVQFVFMPVPSARAVTPPDRGLGAADGYSVFGKNGVTNSGAPTHVWGNVGADSSVSGLTGSQVDGSINTGAGVAGVETDASSTYDSLMSATQGTPTIFDLAGTNTIGPGVYDVGATTLNGALTLDGAGVYIFRSSSSNTTSGGTMNLINGACASNVFWAVSASMTISSGSHVEGTIIAQTGLISLGTNASLVGRAISLISQVTLLSNQITQPTCSTPTPTATPTATPASTATPAPTATPTPTSASAASSGSSSTSGASVCTSSGITTVPNIIEAKRLSPTSIFVKWGPDAGLNNFIIQYGVQNGSWQFSTKVSGFSTTINDLPVNSPVWIEVAATDNCAVGAYGSSVRIGGTPLTNSPGFPNTGSPGFPNTGFEPSGRGNLWKILAGVSLGLTAVYFIRKAYKSSKYEN